MRLDLLYEEDNGIYDGKFICPCPRCGEPTKAVVYANNIVGKQRVCLNGHKVYPERPKYIRVPSDYRLG